MEWYKLFLEALITFGATFMGVRFAIGADDRRERENDKRIKERLVLGLYQETKAIHKFLSDTPTLQDNINYVIETSILETTVSDQIKHLGDSSLVKELSTLRNVTLSIKSLFKMLLEAMPQQRYNTDPNWQKLNALKSNWGTYQQNGLQSIGIILKLLESELPEGAFKK